MNVVFTKILLQLLIIQFFLRGLGSGVLRGYSISGKQHKQQAKAFQ